jgi:hypothetical protein
VSTDDRGSRDIALLLQKLPRGEQRLRFLLEEIRKLVLQLLRHDLRTFTFVLAKDPANQRR